MMCFRDRSFCSMSTLCAKVGCIRNFNREQQEEARKWMGDDAPVSFSDHKTDTCGFINKEENE